MSSLGRVVGVLRAGTQILRHGPRRIITRNGGGDAHVTPRYRQAPYIPKDHVYLADFTSGFMWFWILWWCWHDSDMVLGHFPWPDASAWTDEELGIPPDDYEE